MKNIENMNALGDMAMEAVVGGDYDRTIVDDFVDWLLAPVGEFVNALADAIDSDDRPLPFPQNRRGNKAPSAPMHKVPGMPYDPHDSNPFDFPFM